MVTRLTGMRRVLATGSLVHESATYRGRKVVDGEDYDDGCSYQRGDLG